VEVEDGLARACSAIGHGAIAIEQLQLSRKLRRHEVHLADHRLIFLGGFVQGSKMFAGDDEDMRGRLRTDVFKREDIVVLVNDFRGDLFRRDFAKQTVHAHGPLLMASPNLPGK
jgi:hypothetical protein